MSDVEHWSLQELPGCFDGAIPPVVATCSATGEPNVTHLSQLYLVDGCHIALSNQFFGKTAANLAQNPSASVLVTDSQTYATFRFGLRFDHTEEDGPLFERLRSSIESIGALMHMGDVFRLRGADVYEVVSVERIAPGRTG